jgi:hypothetical protein
LFHYAESPPDRRPHFVNWNESFRQATNGESVGNLRSMHNLAVVG